jgi:hypothetical protein
MDPIVLNVFFAESFNEIEGETVSYSLQCNICTATGFALVDLYLHYMNI